MKSLVAHGGDLNALDSYDDPPLAGAISSEAVGAILWLMDNGADPRLLDRDTRRQLGRIAYVRNLTKVLGILEQI